MSNQYFRYPRNTKRFSSERSSAVERRRRRRGKVPYETVSGKNKLTTEKRKEESPTNSFQRPIPPSNSIEEGLETFEKLIGLKDDQLKDLMDIELPIPQEDKSTGKAVDPSESNGNVFKLPELKSFLRDSSKPIGKTETTATAKVDRRNNEEYKKFLVSNPFADSDETYFTKEYDIIPSIFGTGKLLGIGVSYLQAGHLIFLFVALVSGFLYSPGNPLTDLPIEIREFLQQGLLVIYSINAVLAIQGYYIAKSKNLPSLFWLGKVFLFGGLALYEVKQAEVINPVKR